MPEVLDEKPYEMDAFAGELAAAAMNLAVGSTLVFENEHVRVWDLTLQPGERAPFHTHTLRYFWTCVQAGIADQRTLDGVNRRRHYRNGDTLYTHHDEQHHTVHDLENVGDTVLRFTTVELLDLLPTGADGS
jgi:quercetin dioxygenase-like cupin family protein